jgi:hypothetical protein
MCYCISFFFNLNQPQLTLGINEFYHLHAYINLKVNEIDQISSHFVSFVSQPHLILGGWIAQLVEHLIKVWIPLRCIAFPPSLAITCGAAS